MVLKTHAVTKTTMTLAISLLHLLFATKIVSAINWQSVKPMFLFTMEEQQIVRAENKSIFEPLVVNLETETLVDELKMGGVKAMDRIFGGDVAEMQTFPYQVGLLLQRPRGLYWCGGALISDEFVLTAAHCVDMAKRALVFLGAHEIKNANEVGQIRIMVNQSNFIIYPGWNAKRLKDDIALVQLPNSIDFSDRIYPIQLPHRSYEYRNFSNKLSIASGWGRYSSDVSAISNVLRYVHLQIVDNEECRTAFPRSFRSTNVCTSGQQMRSTCSGDSGGPLVLRRRYSKKRVLVGLTSFGSIHGCDKGYPAAFTKVASYLDWINDETGIELPEESANAVLYQRFLKQHFYGIPYRDSNKDETDELDSHDIINNDDDDFMESSVTPLDYQINYGIVTYDTNKNNHYFTV